MEAFLWRDDFSIGWGFFSAKLFTVSPGIFFGNFVWTSQIMESKMISTVGAGDSEPGVSARQGQMISGVTC